MVYFGPYGVPIKRTTGKYVICPQTILVLQKLLLKYTPTLEQKLFADSVALVFKKKGAEICELSSQLRILVKESQSMWKHSCQKCTRQIFSSQKFLFDLKQNLNDLCTSISSVKRLKSCSTRVSVKDHLTRPGWDGPDSLTGRVWKKSALEPTTTPQPLNDLVEEEMTNFINFPVDEGKSHKQHATCSWWHA